MTRFDFAKAALVVGAAVLTTGCARDFSMDFELQNLPEGAGDISVGFDQIRLEDGLAVAVIARPLESSDKMDWETQVELEPTFNSSFRVERMDWDEDAEERKDHDLRDGDWNFMLWGVTPGQGTLEVFIDGDFEAEIPVFVNPQPPID
jgi:hypothetical protein